MLNWPLESNAVTKDVREAAVVVLVIILTFVVVALWAKRNKRKRDGK